MWIRYCYVVNRPVNLNDPTGHWLETALDIAFIAYDIYDISQNGLNWTNRLSLAADVASVVLPIVTGGGLAVRAIAHADDVTKVISHADEAARAANSVDNILDAGRAAEGGGDLSKFITEGQEFVDDVVVKYFKNVDVTHYPKYNPELPSDVYGQATKNLSTEIGPKAILEGKKETVITIAHEEMHHRLWRRGWVQSEKYVEAVAQRFARRI